MITFLFFSVTPRYHLDHYGPYHFSATKFTWAQAVQYCSSLPGHHLAALETAEEQAEIEQFVQDNAGNFTNSAMCYLGGNYFISGKITLSRRKLLYFGEIYFIFTMSFQGFRS